MMSMHQLLDELQLETMPEGYKKVSVIMTDLEYANLRKVANVTSEGTMSAAIRRAMKWKETPYGIKVVLVHLLEAKRAKDSMPGSPPCKICNDPTDHDGRPHSVAVKEPFGGLG